MRGPGEAGGPSEPKPGPEAGGPRVPGSRTAQQRMASAYQGTIESVVAVGISGLAGYWVDRRFGTEPTGFLVGMTIGFAAFVLRIWRMRKLMGGTVATDETGQSRGNDEPPESK